MNRQSGLALLAALLLAGCAAAAEPAATPPATPEVTATIEPTPAPTPSLEPSQEPIAVRVTFDGEQCIYEGPRVFLDGTEVLFEFVPIGEWEDHSALIVGDVSPGMTWDWVRTDTDNRAAHDKPTYLIGYELLYGRGILSYTMSSMVRMVRGDRPTAGYLVACLTDPETTDDAFFAELLTIAGG